MSTVVFYECNTCLFHFIELNITGMKVLNVRTIDLTIFFKIPNQTYKYGQKGVDSLVTNLIDTAKLYLK